VDAGEAQTHEAAVVELPVLVAIGSEMLAAVVVPLVREADGDPVAGEGPQLLDQPVVELPRPLAGEQSDDRRPTLDELGAVPPAAVLGVAQGHGLWTATVPGILGQADLLCGGLGREGGNGWSRHRPSSRGRQWGRIVHGSTAIVSGTSVLESIHQPP